MLSQKRGLSLVLSKYPQSLLKEVCNMKKFLSTIALSFAVLFTSNVYADSDSFVLNTKQICKTFGQLAFGQAVGRFTAGVSKEEMLSTFRKNVYAEVPYAEGFEPGFIKSLDALERFEQHKMYAEGKDRGMNDMELASQFATITYRA